MMVNFKLGDKDEIINMTRAWDKEKIWIPDRNRSLDLPYTGRAHITMPRKGFPLLGIMTRPKETKGYWTADLFVYYRAKVSWIRAVPIFSHRPLRLERKSKDVFKIFQQTSKIVVVWKGPLIYIVLDFTICMLILLQFMKWIRWIKFTHFQCHCHLHNPCPKAVMSDMLPRHQNWYIRKDQILNIVII